MDDLGTDISVMFADTGPLAQALAGFEPRDGQRQMAAAVSGVIERGGTLLAEAGTGTGKTLAYLIPAILSRQRALISTGTKNLQEQIFFKDLPTLRDALGVPFTATLMKGRSNYLCLHRFQTFEVATSDGLFEQPERAVFLPVIQEWARDHDDRRSCGAARSAGGPPDLEGDLGRSRYLSRHRVPTLRRLLRHADAPARRGVGRRDRQSSPAVRRRIGPHERVRRGDSRVRDARRGRGPSNRRRGDAVLRCRRQQLPRRRSGAGW